MSKDDYHVIVYRILAYLYACMKTGEQPNLEYLKSGTQDFPVVESYWNIILKNLFKDEYITGIILIPVLGYKDRIPKITDRVMITPKGIEYLQDNSMMAKVKEFLKTLKDTIPGF